MAVPRIKRFSIRVILLAALGGLIAIGLAVSMRFLLSEIAFNRYTEWIPYSVDRFSGLLVYSSICGAVIGGLAAIPSGVGSNPLPFVRCLFIMMVVAMLFVVLQPPDLKSSSRRESWWPVPPVRVLVFLAITNVAITGYSLYRGRSVSRSDPPNSKITQ